MSTRHSKLPNAFFSRKSRTINRIAVRGRYRHYISVTQTVRVMSTPNVPTNADPAISVPAPVESQAAKKEEALILSYRPVHVDRLEYINKKWRHHIANNTTRFKKATNHAELVASQPIQDLMAEFDMFSDFMMNVVVMTKKLAKESYIKRYLELNLDPVNRFPTRMTARAQALKAKWDAENWGEDVDEASEGEDLEVQEDSSSQASSGRRPSGSGKGVSLGVPPPNHPIWGVHGIMHGLTMKRNPISYVQNIHVPQRSFSNHGHNGQVVGQWYARQAIAHMRGCHGNPVRGIAGSEKDGGAFSVVVSGSGAYSDLDNDKGDVIYYSGSGSHKNRNPNFPGDSTPGTRALHRSIITGKPVRVLRSAGAERTRLQPQVGIRYDGLYTVVGFDTPLNTNGGMYERFELRRMPGQTPLAELAAISPTERQIAHYARITDGY